MFVGYVFNMLKKVIIILVLAMYMYYTIEDLFGSKDHR